MRLIATFDDEKMAIAFARHLTKKGIENSFEPRQDPESQKNIFCVWVQNEDRIDEALAEKERFEKEPQEELDLKMPEEEQPQAPKVEMKEQVVLRRAPLPITRILILICAVLFLFDSYQRIELEKKMPAYAEMFGITSIDAALFYDFPEAYVKIKKLFEQNPGADLDGEIPQELVDEAYKIEEASVWRRLYHYFDAPKELRKSLNVPMFEKIRKGEVWRTFTPSILHKGFLHILFNMLWLWILGRQVELRSGKGRYILITLILGIVSNTCQYIASGPFFLGYSGIITGLAGYIWMRQRVAPWEDYNLPRGTLLFLGIFIFGMLAFQIITFFLRKGGLGVFEVNIANTAHISGAVAGVVLGAIPSFGGNGCR